MGRLSLRHDFITCASIICNHSPQSNIIKMCAKSTITTSSTATTDMPDVQSLEITQDSTNRMILDDEEQPGKEIIKFPRHEGQRLGESGEAVPEAITIKNRRKRYLENHPDYFNETLELADPLLYDRMVRRFQSAAEREAESRRKGFSGMLESDLFRSEAKLAAIQANLDNPTSSSLYTYTRGPDGEIIEQEEGGIDEMPMSREEGWEVWRYEMEMRFVHGRDGEFDYDVVDGDERLDDGGEGELDRFECYLDGEEPRWDVPVGHLPVGETGVQDF